MSPQTTSVLDSKQHVDVRTQRVISPHNMGHCSGLSQADELAKYLSICIQRADIGQVCMAMSCEAHTGELPKPDVPWYGRLLGSVTPALYGSRHGQHSSIRR